MKGPTTGDQTAANKINGKLTPIAPVNTIFLPKRTCPQVSDHFGHPK